MTDGAAGRLLDFQRTGRGFEAFWWEIRPVVEETVRWQLRRRLVRGFRRFDDEVAVAEVCQQVATKLLAVRHSAGGRYRAAAARRPAEGGSRGAGRQLAGWLKTICSREVIEYCRTYRAPRARRRVTAITGLHRHERREAGILMESRASRPQLDAFELRDILADCLTRLPPELGGLIQLKLREDLSVREIEARLGVDVSTVQRRLSKARQLLEPLLAGRGIDAAWLGSGAA